MYTTLKEVLNEAEDLNMAIGAFNTHNLEMLPSIIKVAVNQRTPFFFAYSTTLFVPRMLSFSGKDDPSNITELYPASIAFLISS